MSLVPSIQNNFNAGLKTEFTGINFPPNAWVQGQDVVPTIIGDVTRRVGISLEHNFTSNPSIPGFTIGSPWARAISTYRWVNAGGDGQTEIIVAQVGATIFFYESSLATTASPLSTQLLASTLTLSSVDGSDPSLQECQYTDGNGYLFIFHPKCDPIYCQFQLIGTTPVVIPNVITIQTRDFLGFYESPSLTTFRPLTLTPEHTYNLQNQGWTYATSVANWTATSTTPNLTNNTNSIYLAPGLHNFTVATGLSINNTDSCLITWTTQYTYYNNPSGDYYTATGSESAPGTVISYNSGTGALQIAISQQVTLSTAQYPISIISLGAQTFSISAGSNTQTINVWHTQVGNYPSNADIWFLFKNPTNQQFNPATTYNYVGLPNTQAPKGHYIVNAFNQQFSTVSGTTGLTPIITKKRPSTGAWFAGRVFYTGVDDSQIAIGDQLFYTWTENIYFSQIITDIAQAGYCYQYNDPTDENSFNELPSDGGVINIPGSGKIYKLFPIENGIVVFAANGIWFITGSTGIGFTATDYVVRHISNVQSINSTSYINVNGYPMFWNEEAIYYVVPGQQGIGMGNNSMSLVVQNMVLGTILSYYQTIPKISKQYARGDYNRVSYIVQWCFRQNIETGISTRYQMDTILNYNTITKAFYTYTINQSTANYISDIRFVQYPGGVSAPNPSLKYFTYAIGPNNAYMATSFAEEWDTSYLDWGALTYNSYFISAYTLPGKAITKAHNLYTIMYLRNNVNSSYRIQSIRDFAINRSSGKWSGIQLVQDTTSTTNFGMSYKRHKLRGRGMSLQIKVQSYQQQPFDIMGWSVLDDALQGV